MPAISKIRFTNIIYENGGKRYNDMVFNFDGQNSAILLENGGGKTVLIQTALQAVIPHIDMADRKIKNTLSLENGPAHVAIEWIINESPKRYVVTAVSLYIENNVLNSYKYVNEYSPGDDASIEKIPFAIKMPNGVVRPAGKGEMSEYYYRMKKSGSFHARLFDTIKDYGAYIEEQYKIIPSEWRSIAEINSGEGNVDEYFSKCKTTGQLLNNLLIPVVESAIGTDNKKQFVDTFEKQREHFKKNKLLQLQIQQSEMVKEKIDEYIIDFKGYHDTLEAFDDLRKKAHEVFDVTDGRVNEVREASIFNNDKMSALHRQKEELRRKKLSYEIQSIEDELRALEQSKKLEETAYEAENTQLETALKRRQNIEITLLEEKIRISVENIKHIEFKLEQVSAEDDLKQLEERFKLNACHIKGYYDHIIGEIDDKCSTLQASIEENTKTLEERKNEKEDLINNEKKLSANIIELRTTIDLAKKDIIKIQEQLYSDDVSMPFTEYLTILEKNEKRLKQELDETYANLEQGKEELKQLGEQKVYNDESLMGAKNDLFENQKRKEDIELEKERLLKAIDAVGHFVYRGQSIYEKSDSLQNSLIEKRSKLWQEKEDALLKERMNKRIIDMYGDVEEFMADIGLEKIVKGLVHSTSFIQHGTTYLKSMVDDTEVQDAFEKYPLWAMTLVTTENDVKQVENTITEQMGELFYPVIILTTAQAQQALQDGIKVWKNGTSIYPESWRGNLREDGFKRFIEEGKALGVKAEKIRLEKEGQLSDITALIKRVSEFFEEHPNVKYTLINERISELKQEIEQRGIRASVITGEMDTLRDRERELLEKVQIYSEGISTCRSHIGLAKEGIEKEERVRLKEEQFYLERSQQDKLKKHLENVSENIEALKRRLEELEKQIGNYNTEKQILMQQDLFKKVVEAEGVLTDVPLVTLKKIHTDLRDQIRGLNANRSYVEEELSREKAILKETRSDKNRKVKRAKFEIEIAPLLYQKEEDDLQRKIEELEPKCIAIQNKINVINDEIVGKKAVRDMKESELYKQFVSLYKFEQALESVEASLKEEEKDIAHQLRNIEGNIRKLEARQKELEILAVNLEIGKGQYYFDDIAYDRAVYRDLSDEDLKNTCDHLLKALKEAMKNKVLQKDMMIDKRNILIDFCKENISDIRLKEAVVSGIKIKDTYEALLVYQQSIGERICQVIRLREDDKKESDVELQTFLTHLHGYVSNVAAELDVIQRKTVIKVEESYKQIFIFDIPEWEEGAGKEALRNYVNQIIDYFDRESEKEEYDETSIREELEKRLDVTNLLQVVMGEETIKIKCRKVTNDMKINKAPTSWESSNRWSGGEKWSKNMTLFLSILNYVAGKKQHLNEGQKSNRVVILDNPFGKASSNHVLNPVFKIAQKLGFQIIALTAHAEGKFISEYFPVVYSCRLRKAKDQERQVMTTEKQINVAYLKEHSPKSIIALQEVEQLNLLNM